MTGGHDVNRLVTQLHQNKILNADTTGGKLVESVAAGLTNPGEKVGWYVVGGVHYCVVCGRAGPGDIVELGPAAPAVKTSIKG